MMVDMHSVKTINFNVGIMTETNARLIRLLNVRDVYPVKSLCENLVCKNGGFPNGSIPYVSMEEKTPDHEAAYRNAFSFHFHGKKCRKRFILLVQLFPFPTYPV